MDTPAVSPSVPCEYDPDCGGFPLAVPQPAELCCVACQRTARDAFTACKGPCLSARMRTQAPPHTQAQLLANESSHQPFGHPLLLLQGDTCGAPAARRPRCPSHGSARAAAVCASASPQPALPHALSLRRCARGALRGAGGRGRWGRWTHTGRSAGARGSRAR